MRRALGAGVVLALLAAAPAEAKRIAVDAQVVGGIVDRGGGRFDTTGLLSGGLRGGYHAEVTQSGADFTGRFTYGDGRGSLSGDQQRDQHGRRPRPDRVRRSPDGPPRHRRLREGARHPGGERGGRRRTGYVRERVTGTVSVTPARPPRSRRPTTVHRYRAAITGAPTDLQDGSPASPGRPVASPPGPA